MTTCPNGHTSTLEDFCSECGTKMSPSAAAAPPTSASSPGPSSPSASGSTCKNCQEPHLPDDVFCESCGYDFLSGSLPQNSQAPTTSGATAAAVAAGVDPDAPPAHPAPTVTAAPTPVVCTVQVSKDFFDRMDAAGSVDFPDPIPEPVTVELKSDQVLIGRLSESRGVYPGIDVSASNDPAASTRHAMLRRSADGAWTITDVGSTNGTYLDDAVDPLAPDSPTPIDENTVIFVGAWTQITLAFPS